MESSHEQEVLSKALVLGEPSALVSRPAVALGRHVWEPPNRCILPRSRLEHEWYIMASFLGGGSSSPSLLYSSPAHYAATIGSTELLKDLRRRSADADLTALDHLSRTPLSYAVENQNEFAVKLLVDQKYPRRGWNSISHTYLGPGHVWYDKKRKAAAIPSKEIQKALKGVGFSV